MRESRLAFFYFILVQQYLMRRQLFSTLSFCSDIALVSQSIAVTLEDYLLNGASDDDQASFNKIRDVLLDGLKAVVEARPEDSITWLAEWLRNTQLPNDQSEEDQAAPPDDDGQQMIEGGLIKLEQAAKDDGRNAAEEEM